jgi:hypothetical protein
MEISNSLDCVRHISEEYRRFLKTTLRLCDDHIRNQFEEQIREMKVVINDPDITLGRDHKKDRSLEALVQEGIVHPGPLQPNWPFGKERERPYSAP